MAKGIIPKNAYPACKHCERGRFSNNAQKILCERKGIVDPDYYCKKYRYNPLKRIPVRAPVLPSFNADEFKI